MLRTGAPPAQTHFIDENTETQRSCMSYSFPQNWVGTNNPGLKSANFKLLSYLILSLLLPCHEGKSGYKEDCDLCRESPQLVAEGSRREVRSLVSDRPQFESWPWNWVVLANFLLHSSAYVSSSVQMRIRIIMSLSHHLLDG